MRREIVKQVEDEAGINSALEWTKAMLLKALQAGPAVVRLSRPTRTIDQNSKLWPTLTELSKQVDWYGNKLTPEEWKIVLTASLKKQKVVPGLDGEFVVLGASTSRMTIAELSALIELAYAFGAERGVKFKVIYG